MENEGLPQINQANKNISTTNANLVNGLNLRVWSPRNPLFFLFKSLYKFFHYLNC